MDSLKGDERFIVQVGDKGVEETVPITSLEFVYQ